MIFQMGKPKFQKNHHLGFKVTAHTGFLKGLTNRAIYDTLLHQVSLTTIRRWVLEFSRMEEGAVVCHKRPPGRPRSVRTERNIRSVKSIIASNTVRSTGRQLGISQRSMRRIVDLDIGLYVFIFHRFIYLSFLIFITCSFSRMQAL